jgi:hypothetical protein
VGGRGKSSEFELSVLSWWGSALPPDTSPRPFFFSLLFR